MTGLPHKISLKAVTLKRLKIKLKILLTYDELYFNQ